MHLLWEEVVIFPITCLVISGVDIIDILRNGEPLLGQRMLDINNSPFDYNIMDTL